MFQLKALVSLDLFKNKTKLLMTSFTLTMYGLELFITAFLSMANYTGWEFKTALSVQHVVKVSIAMFRYS